MRPGYPARKARRISEEATTRRIRQARETRAALARINANRSSQNIAALHRIHARHLRENGDPAGAAEAEARAERVEAQGSFVIPRLNG
jgi:hypothetical protein